MCVGVGIDRADELGRLGERGIVRVHLRHGEHRGERLLEGQQVAQFLLDQVTDHALGLAPRTSNGYAEASSYAAACNASTRPAARCRAR